MAGGHEAAGIVEQVGEKVTDLKVGDMVATGYEGCGHCPACREGHIDQCEEIRNDTEDGYKWGFFGFSNYCVKNSSGVYKVANDLNPSEAGFMEPLATVIHGAKKLRLKPFETVVVIGAGTMGLINAQTAKAYGCRVIVSEMIPKKIETVKAMGFEVIDCNESDPVEKVKELTEGIGADAVKIIDVAAHTYPSSENKNPRRKSLNALISVEAPSISSFLISFSPSSSFTAVSSLPS